jgi:hypothetical protein
MELFETSQGARDAEVRSKIEAITKKLRSVETKERRLLDLYLEEGLATAEVTARLRTITKERSALTAERERAVAQAAELGATVDRAAWIERWSTEAAKGLDDLDDLGRQRFLQAVVDEIIVKPDRTLEIRGLIPAEASAQVSSQPSPGSASLTRSFVGASPQSPATRTATPHCRAVATSRSVLRKVKPPRCARLTLTERSTVLAAMLHSVSRGGRHERDGALRGL